MSKLKDNYPKLNDADATHRQLECTCSLLLELQDKQAIVNPSNTTYDCILAVLSTIIAGAHEVLASQGNAIERLKNDHQLVDRVLRKTVQM